MFLDYFYKLKPIITLTFFASNFRIKPLTKNIKAFACILIFAGFTFHLPAQDSIAANLLLHRIETLQQLQNQKLVKGIFPSYISNSRHFKTCKPDNTIFYNALIVYTLKQMRTQLNIQQQGICDSIIARSKQTLPAFKNTQRTTYNFWRTDSAFRFPYTWWIPLLRGKVTLPDDMDDTVLGLNVADTDDSTAEAVHQLMQLYTNQSLYLKTTYSSYQDYRAYSTWFGKKVPVVFDVCVLTNILCFVYQHNLVWTTADSASLHLIVACINNNDYVKHPLMLSPYYGTTSIILYHLARLMNIYKIPELEALRERLATTALEIYSSSDNDLEKIMLSTALLKWNYKMPPVKIHSVKQVEENDYPFFIGNIPSYLTQPVKEWLMNKDILLFYHFCPAWNDVLLLENILLRKNVNNN